MTQASDNDLEYGHLRNLRYVPRAQTWSSSRRPGSVLTKDSNIGHEQQWAARGRSGETDHTYTADGPSFEPLRSLSHDYPEVVPALYLLEDLEKTSIAKSVHGPRGRQEQRNLLAFGYAKAPRIRVDGEYVDRVPLLALPSGEHGEILCVVQLRSSRSGWADTSEPWLKTFEISEDCMAHEPGLGAPILQIVFSEPGAEAATPLAVRYPASISIFLPIYSTESCRPGDHGNRGRLELSHIATISVREHMHSVVDMTFNPFYQQQLAVIDKKGVWKVLEIQRSIFGATGQRMHSVSRLHHSLPVQVIAAGQAAVPHGIDSGPVWQSSRVTWIRSATQLVVASVASVQLYYLPNNGPPETSYNLGTAKNACYVLDMQKRADNEEDLFVLTTDSVVWLRYTLVKVGKPGEPDLVTFSILFSWQHHLMTEATLFSSALWNRSDGMCSCDDDFDRLIDLE